MDSEGSRKQYKRKWISAKRQLKNPSNAMPESDTSDDDCVANNKHDMPGSTVFSSPMPPNDAFTIPVVESSDNNVENTYVYDIKVVEDAVAPDFDSAASGSDSDSEQDEGGCTVINDTELCHNLSSWINECHVNNNTTDKLLKILQKAGHNVPGSARSLLKTVRGVEIISLSDMQYAYLGVSNQLACFMSTLSDRQKEQVDHLEIALNIDGLPLFKSSNVSLWPVLCAVLNVSPVQVFPLVVAGGPTKPNNLDFLNDTIRDLKDVLQNGVLVSTSKLPVILKSVVCDAPARAMAKSMKLYSGYAGCDKCNEKGTWFGKMTFQAVGELRTDDSFRKREQPEHHNGITPFCELPIDMINSFPLDYMHQCCLGVTRKLILAYTYDVLMLIK